MQSLQRRGTIVKDRQAHTHMRAHARTHARTCAHRCARTQIHTRTRTPCENSPPAQALPHARVLKAFRGILEKSPVGAPEPVEEFLKWVRQIGEVGVEQLNRQRGRELWCRRVSVRNRETCPAQPAPAKKNPRFPQLRTPPETQVPPYPTRGGE